MKHDPRRITSLAALRAAIRGGQHDFLLVIVGPLVTRRQIWETDDGRYIVFESVSGATHTVAIDALLATANIGAFMERGALFADRPLRPEEESPRERKRAATPGG